jgi:hypothetical protein
MKIADVEAIYVRLPEVKKQCDSGQDALIVRVHTDEGITGIGEVDSAPLAAQGMILGAYSHTTSSGLRHLLIGEDPFETERLWEKMYRSNIYAGRFGIAIHAMSGIDIALWDIKGKKLGMPIWKLLGGGFRKVIRCYASSLFGNTPEEIYELACRFAGQGFSAVKFGWGPMGKDAATDVALVAAARALPPTPYRGPHFATFPQGFPRRSILAASKPGDAVLDPIGGSGTTGVVAQELGRNAVLLDISPEYFKLMRQRMADASGLPVKPVRKAAVCRAEEYEGSMLTGGGMTPPGMQMVECLRRSCGAHLGNVPRTLPRCKRRTPETGSRRRFPAPVFGPRIPDFCVRTPRSDCRLGAENLGAATAGCQRKTGRRSLKKSSLILRENTGHLG